MFRRLAEAIQDIKKAAMAPSREAAGKQAAANLGTYNQFPYIYRVYLTLELDIKQSIETKKRPVEDDASPELKRQRTTHQEEVSIVLCYYRYCCNLANGSL